MIIIGIGFPVGLISGIRVSRIDSSTAQTMLRLMGLISSTGRMSLHRWYCL